MALSTLFQTQKTTLATLRLPYPPDADLRIIASTLCAAGIASDSPADVPERGLEALSGVRLGTCDVIWLGGREPHSQLALARPDMMHVALAYSAPCRRLRTPQTRMLPWVQFIAGALEAKAVLWTQQRGALSEAALFRALHASRPKHAALLDEIDGPQGTHRAAANTGLRLNA